MDGIVDETWWWKDAKARSLWWWWCCCCCRRVQTRRNCRTRLARVGACGARVRRFISFMHRSTSRHTRIHHNHENALSFQYIHRRTYSNLRYQSIIHQELLRRTQVEGSNGGKSSMRMDGTTMIYDDVMRVRPSMQRRSKLEEWLS